MKRLMTAAALAWLVISVVLSAGRQAGSPGSAATAAPAGAAVNDAVVAGRPSAPTPAATSPNPGLATQYRAMVDRYCVTCHNARLKIPAGAPLNLEKLDLGHPEQDAETWERVVRKLGVGAMPPQGAPRPDTAALNEFQAWLAGSLDAAAERHPNPGRFVLHRLNRVEYQNSIRDVLDLDIDAAALLPPDSSDFGFDNIATVLTTSPALLERYLTAAMRIAALAVGDPGIEVESKVYPLRIDLTQNGQIDGLPIGSRGGTVVRHNFPLDGEYTLSGSLFRTLDNGDTGIEGQDSPHEFRILIDGVQVHSALIGGPTDEAHSYSNLGGAADIVAARMQVRTFVAAGPHDVAFTFVARPARPQELMQLSLRSSQDLHMAGQLAKLKQVTIAGPYEPSGVGDTPSRRRVYVCKPTPATEDACARRILSTVARRAYRRPVSAADTDLPMSFFRRARASGDFDAGLRAALPVILANPSFLYRSERDPAPLAVGASHPVTDLELASRLSFFLWSSGPDDELLSLASANRLRAPGMLERQVRRMLADTRAAAMTDNFAQQWLQLRNLERVVPDLLEFPEFDDNLRQAFARETELFFGSMVREDRSVLDLLNADYTFVNERLARHYGISRVIGPQFRRVTVADANRRGLLGHGSVLSLTSRATRTSPVLRGKYILSTFLNTPPLPPPPDVPALEENTGASKPKSVRERLEAHRANAVCASCHRSMDPIGFALENFDAVGQWRSATEAGTPVDASGTLVDGSVIDGPIALRRALTNRPGVFVGTLTENLLTYALGRGLEPYDRPVVRRIVRDAAAGDYRFMSIITGIVQSRPFQMRVKAVPTVMTTARSDQP